MNEGLDQGIEPVTDEVFDQLLNQDPIRMAEAVTGLAIDDDGGTADLGLWVAGMHHSALERQLIARGDTLFRDTVERYQKIIRTYKFEEVLRIPYMADNGPDELYVYYHPSLGALLVFHTVSSYLVEGAALYYQWISNPDTTFFPTGSGTLHEGRWVGHFDAHEALLFRINRLKQHGQFVTPWVHFDGWPDLSPWIIHPGDGKIEDPDEFKKLVTKRLQLLPWDVQEAIGFRRPTWD